MAAALVLVLVTATVLLMPAPSPPRTDIAWRSTIGGVAPGNATPVPGIPTAVARATPEDLAERAVDATPSRFPVSDEPVPILMYHYVRPDPGPDDPVGQGLSVSPELFAEHLAYLAQAGYTPVTMAELAEIWQGTRARPANPIVLTFDDGYRDFYTNAWPILQQYGFPATVYLISAFLDEPNYLTRAMVQELDASGMVDFGSHSVHHPDLPSLSDVEAESEIAGSKHALEDLLGHQVSSFCYPTGSYSDREIALVKAAGYALAVTTEWDYAEPSMDAFELPRLRMNAWTTTEDLARWL